VHYKAQTFNNIYRNNGCSETRLDAELFNAAADGEYSYRRA